MKRFSAVVAVMVLPAMVGLAQGADTVAYDNVGAGVLQNFGNSLGLDFLVNSPINITQLGAFDAGDPAKLNGVDGTSGITVQIYDNTTNLPVGPSVTFSPSNPGTQVNQNVFAPVIPFTLPAGFQGSVVAFNDPNYNSNGSTNTTSTEDTGGGLISFVGGGRFGFGFSYPTNTDGGPTNRYDAGTFAFAATPEPASVGLLGIAATALIARRRRA